MKDIWINGDNRDDRERLVAVEYQDGHPCSVLTENHWDHSRRPWFKAGRDQPNGTSAKWYDFDWCQRDETLYFHISGCGGNIRFHVARFVHPVPPKGLIWVAPGIPIVMSTRDGDRTITTDAELLALGYRRIKKPRLLPYWGSKTRNPFEAGQWGETVYCGRCRDDLPTEQLCEHVDWCDDCGLYFYTDDRSFVYETGKCDCPAEDD